MKKQKHYFLINKIRDYEKSAFEHMEYDKQGFWLTESFSFGPGIFLSRVLDSREKEMEWHRLTLKVNDESGSPYGIKVYATDEPYVRWQDKKLSVAEIILKEDMTGKEKLKCLECFCQLETVGRNELLLHEIKGRYLWISIEAYQQGKQKLKFEEIKVCFPKQSWLSYLPEIYEASDKEHFLDKYLSVFQSIYDDMNVQIGKIPYLLDVTTADSEYLDFLCQWVGIVTSQMWKTEKKRKFLKEAAKLFKIRGTREGILAVLGLYLDGGDAFLVEKYYWNHWRMPVERKKLLESLYGASSYMLTIMVGEDKVPGKKEYLSLRQLLYSVIPAQADLNLVVLKPFIMLDGHSYLGVNSVLGNYQPAKLDGKSVLSFSRIGEENQKER